MKERHTKTSTPARRVWPLWAVIIGIAGVAIYFSTYFPVLRAFEPWIKFAENFGIALVISATVALVLERLVHESLLNEIIGAVESIKKGSDVLKGAGELGIEDIFARRIEVSRERANVRIKKAIEEQLSKKSGEVLISCVAAPDFLVEGSEIGDMLWKHLSEPKNMCNLRIILICPQSQWAILRADLESGHPTIKHIKISANFLHNLRAKCGDKVKFKCYDFPPLTFMIITENFLFVETYLMMHLKPGEGPLGGKTPTLVVRRDTETYKRWKNHFDFIWKEHSQDYEKHHEDEFATSSNTA